MRDESDLHGEGVVMLVGAARAFEAAVRLARERLKYFVRKGTMSNLVDATSVCFAITRIIAYWTKTGRLYFLLPTLTSEE